MIAKFHLGKSTQIKEFEYSEADKTLIVTFNNDQKYLYSDVPLTTALSLAGSTSSGSYWNKVKGDFNWKKI